MFDEAELRRMSPRERVKLMQALAVLDMPRLSSPGSTRRRKLFLLGTIVCRSSETSNHASQSSSVASTSKHMISTCRPRQAAQAVMAKVTSSATSNPTHAPCQSPVR